MTTVIANATIVTGNADRDVLHDAAIAILEDRIAAIGPTAAVRPAHPDAEVVDGHGKAVFPFGASGKAVSSTSLTFVSRAAYEAGVHRDPGLSRRVEPARGRRTITKRQMVRNDGMPVTEVDLDTDTVRVDYEIASLP